MPAPVHTQTALDGPRLDAAVAPGTTGAVQRAAGSARGAWTSSARLSVPLPLVLLAAASPSRAAGLGVRAELAASAPVTAPQRATAVRDALVERGIASARLEVHGAGDSKPDPLPTKGSRTPTSRRVDFTVVRCRSGGEAP